MMTSNPLIGKKDLSVQGVAYALRYVADTLDCFMNKYCFIGLSSLQLRDSSYNTKTNLTKKQMQTLFEVSEM